MGAVLYQEFFVGVFFYGIYGLVGMYQCRHQRQCTASAVLYGDRRTVTGIVYAFEIFPAEGLACFRIHFPTLLEIALFYERQEIRRRFQAAFYPVIFRMEMLVNPACRLLITISPQR